MRLTAALALAFVIPAAFAPAQTPAGSAPQASADPTPPPTTLTSNSTLVLVPALVREKKSGQLIFTLKADDFVLTDDGVPQKLTLEQTPAVNPSPWSSTSKAEAPARANWTNMPRLPP